MIRKFYKQNGRVYEYAIDGSQDHLIGDKLRLTAEEVEAHLNRPMTVEQAVAHFKAYTNTYIQERINVWNEDNKSTGIRFDDINSFPKYAVIPTDSRCSISMQFLIWNGAIWDTATAYMLSATTIPTEAEFKSVLDAVEF